MSLQAKEPSCLSVGRGRAELPPVAWEVGETVEIPRSREQSRMSASSLALFPPITLRKVLA